MELIGSVLNNVIEQTSARAVIINDKEEVCLMYVSGHDKHKLPGGTVNEDEKLLDALNRECKEEMGADNLELMAEIGKVEVIRQDLLNDNKIYKQDSYTYLCKLVGELGETNMTENEKKLGFEVRWYPIHEVEKIMEDDMNDVSNCNLIIKNMVSRDYIIIKKGIELYKNLEL